MVSTYSAFTLSYSDADHTVFRVLSTSHWVTPTGVFAVDMRVRYPVSDGFEFDAMIQQHRSKLRYDKYEPVVFYGFEDDRKMPFPGDEIMVWGVRPYYQAGTISEDIERAIHPLNYTTTPRGCAKVTRVMQTNGRSAWQLGDVYFYRTYSEHQEYIRDRINRNRA